MPVSPGNKGGVRPENTITMKVNDPRLQGEGFEGIGASYGLKSFARPLLNPKVFVVGWRLLAL